MCASGSMVGMRGDRRRGSVVGTSGDAVGVRRELPGCCSDHARYIGFVLAAAEAAACADSALNSAAHEPSGAVMPRAGEFLEDPTKGTPPPGRVPDAFTAGSGPCMLGEDPLDEHVPAVAAGPPLALLPLRTERAIVFGPYFCGSLALPGAE